MAPVVRALVCAHEHKLVHRDLKPGNIFLTNSGTIKVLYSFSEPNVAAIAQDGGERVPRGNRAAHGS